MRLVRRLPFAVPGKSTRAKDLRERPRTVEGRCEVALLDLVEQAQLLRLRMPPMAGLAPHAFGSGA